MTLKTTLLHFFFLSISLKTSAQIVFVEDAAQSFEGAAQGNLTFADIDNDGDQDFLSIGINADLDTMTVLYKNDGSGNFNKIDNINLNLKIRLMK